MMFWQHDVNVTLPNAVWTPMPWNRPLNTLGSPDAPWSHLFSNQELTTTPLFAQTTIAAGSNGLALPQGTINVASVNATTTTPAFTSSGYLVVRIASTDRVVRYTGVSGGNQFTGCTLGVGTMTTGDMVRQANVTFGPATTCLSLFSELAWASNGTGVRGARVRIFDGGFNLPLGTDVRGAVVATDPLLRTLTAEQPVILAGIASSPLLGVCIEGYQSSTGNLDSVLVGGEISAPRIVSFNFPTEISL